jgi:hypothetical protein
VLELPHRSLAFGTGIHQRIVANTDVGLWLHHIVKGNAPRKDVLCPDFKTGYRFFTCGNNRTLIEPTLGGYAHPKS